MSYPPGHFTKPVRLWFGPYWEPKCDWTPTKQKATRTSADGDAMRIKPFANYPVTKPKGAK